MHILVAVVHAIGEDNEGNTSVVARSEDELDAKLLKVFTDWYSDPEDLDAEPCPFSTLDEARQYFHWNVDEHEVTE